MNVEVVFAVGGVIALLLCFFGGGVGGQFIIPTISGISRFFLGITGLILIILAVALPRIDSILKNPSQPAEVVITKVPQAVKQEPLKVKEQEIPIDSEQNSPKNTEQEPIKDTPQPLPANISIDQAIRHYFDLVNQQQYEQAYTMLAENFKENSGVPTIDVYIQEWSKIGLATILAPIEVKQYGDTATATLVLVFPKSKKPLVRRYYLNHIQECNNLEFGCWQIVGKD